MKVKVDYKKCCWKDGGCSSCSCGGPCVGCVESCPVGALSRKEKVLVDLSKCTGCGACVDACGHEAISLF